MERVTIGKMARTITTESEAYAYMERLRWPGKPVCPHCGSINDHYFLTPVNGVSRATRTGTRSQRRVWKCRDCRKQFSVLTGTVFHGSKVPLRTWLFVVFEMCANKNGIAAREIERKYGVAPKTAWFMAHRLREAMRIDPGGRPFVGIVVSDETWIGGEPANRHAHRRTPDGRQGHTEKTPVVSLISTGTGEVRSKVVPNVTSKTLSKVMADNIIPEGTVLHTDSAASYGRVTRHFAGHATVNHTAGEYVRDGVSTNKAENYFSQLKRSLDGTHHRISQEHLPRYLAEFDFRYTTCKINDTDRMSVLMGRTGGRRLSYRPLTGR